MGITEFNAGVTGMQDRREVAGGELGGRQGARSKRRGAGLQGIHRGSVDRGTGK